MLAVDQMGEIGGLRIPVSAEDMTAAAAAIAASQAGASHIEEAGAQLSHLDVL
jgi:hypothetical protein